MSSSGIPLDKAELLATLLEGILYGFSLLMFGGTMWQLIMRRSTKRVNRKMLTAACLLLLCSTAHIIIDIIRIMEGLILYRDSYPGGPIAFFANASEWTFVSKNFLYTVQALIGDGVILYRCYVVWQSKFIMILPALLWCATAVTGIGSPYSGTQTSKGNNNVFSGSTVKWITSWYAISFTTNMLTTLLLVFRLWYLDWKAAKLRGHPRSQLRDILRTIIDAGGLYLFTLLVALICFVSRSNSQYVLLDMIMPIISIAFYMVIIRLGLLSNRANYWQPRSTRPPRDASTTNNSGSGERGAMEVRITTLTEQLVDGGQRSPMSLTSAPNDDHRRKGMFDDVSEALGI